MPPSIWIMKPCSLACLSRLAARSRWLAGRAARNTSASVKDSAIAITPSVAFTQKMMIA